MAASLESTLAAQAQSSIRRPPNEGDQIRVSIDALDENPYQPRKTMDGAALEELKTSLKQEGLIQPIAIRPKSDGRYIIVAGHRRVEAFRQLRSEAGQGDAKWATIPGVVKLAVDDAHLAAMAFMENTARAQLTPLEQARSIKQMLDAGLVKSNDEAAALLALPARTVQRLLRLARAPRFITDATDSGVMVVTGVDSDGKERKELRRIELMLALQFQALFEHLSKTKPRVAEERTEAAMRRALAGNWSLRRTEEYVQGIQRGKADADAAAESAEPGAAEAGSTEAVEAAVFDRTPRRFVVDLSRLKAATASQREALRAAFAAVLEEVSAHG